ncbi:hypothetical protein VTP01DRAFT_8353 [Rhizomucor pusillus]|uniref:uncharacterized protein n=1 Tax=Rhizomucor pusillus TaxID=4840 RepID=UPI003743BC21
MVTDKYRLKYERTDAVVSRHSAELSSAGLRSLGQKLVQAGIVCCFAYHQFQYSVSFPDYDQGYPESSTS